MEKSQTETLGHIPIYTIGYGSRTLREFISILHQYSIGFLVDVRSRPYSSFKPEFSKDALGCQLDQNGIKYVFLGDKLGGQPDDCTCYTEGKVDYDKIREKPFYDEGIARLRIAWQKQLHIALMCSEGKPETCHRSKLIGTSLVNERILVVHIDEADSLKSHEEVLAILTRGQTSLFDRPPEARTSRKKYK